MENPDLVLQETGSRPTYSRLNYVPSGDTLRRDAISSLLYLRSIFVFSNINIEMWFIASSNITEELFRNITTG